MYKFGNLERCDIYEGTAKELEIDGLIIKELSYPILNAKFLDTGMPFNYVMMELKPGKKSHRLFLEYPNAECYLKGNESGVDCLTFLVLFDSANGNVLEDFVAITTEEGFLDEPKSAKKYLFPCEERKLIRFATEFYNRWKDSVYAIDLESSLYND